MGLAQNLVQGFAGAAGASDVVGRIQQNKDQQKQMSQEELRDQSNQVFNDIQRIQQRRSQLDPKSTSYSKDLAGVDADLQQAQETFHDLYHPAKNPGALQHLGGFIRAHVPLWKGQGQPPPTTAGAAKQSIQQRLAGVSAAAGAPVAQPNPILQKRQQRKEAGYTDEQIKKAEEIEAGIAPKAGAEKPEKFQTQLTETTDEATGQKHYWRVPLESGSDPEEVNFKGQKVTPHGTAGQAPKVGSFGDFLTQAYGAHPTAEQYEKGRRQWAQANAGTTTGEHVAFVPQTDGTIKAIVVQTTSTKSFGGGGGAGVPRPSSGGDKTPSFTPPSKAQGMIAPGNIDLGNRPILHNSDGTISSERSFSIGTDKGEVLIPRIFDGKDHTEKEAIEHYRKTGENMGIFDTPEHADAYATAIHNRHIPRTPGEAKERVKPKGAGVVGEGETVGGKKTADQTKADTNYREAVRVAALGDDALANPSAAKDKQLALQIIRSAAGRVNMQEIDMMMSRAGLANKLESWAKSTTTGELPLDVRKQLVGVTKANMAAADKARQSISGSESDDDKFLKSF